MSKNTIKEKIDDENYTHVTYHKNSQNITYYLNNQVTFLDYPCLHLTELYSLIGDEFPYYLIGNPWKNIKIAIMYLFKIILLI